MTVQELEDMCADLTAERAPNNNPHNVHCVDEDDESGLPPGWYFWFGSLSGGFCRIGRFETQQIALGHAATFWASAMRDMEDRVWQ